MAPRSYTPTSLTQRRRSNDDSSSTALPGIKRGIAIGIAASVTILLIALLTYLAIRRRKKLKAHHQQQSSNTPAESKEAWPREKSLEEKETTEQQQSPIEADTRTIYELEAAQNLPELPAKAHVVQELDSASSETPLRDWERWSLALQNQAQLRRSQIVSFGSIEEEEKEEDGGRLRVGNGNGDARQVPVLHISPPEVSPLGSAVGTSPWGVSPLSEGRGSMGESGRWV